MKGKRKQQKKSGDESEDFFHFPLRFFCSSQFSRKQLFVPGDPRSKRAVCVCLYCVWLLCVLCVCACMCVFFMKLPARRSELAANCVEQPTRELSQIFTLPVCECVSACVCYCFVSVCLLILKQHTHTTHSHTNTHAGQLQLQQLKLSLRCPQSSHDFSPTSRTKLMDGRKSSQ